MKPAQRTEYRITIDGVVLSDDHAEFLSCRTLVQETPGEPIPESGEILKTGGFEPCLQCGTCVATCPLAPLMDHPPRRLFLALSLGHVEEALASNTPALCLSCYQCTSRCPRGIPITDLLAAWRDAVARAQFRQEEAARHEATYAAIRQDGDRSTLEAQSSEPEPRAQSSRAQKRSTGEGLPPEIGEPQGEEVRRRIPDELRSFHLEAKEQLFRYRKMAQKARRTGKPQDALHHFDTHLIRYGSTPWYEEMRRVQNELLEWSRHAKP